MSWKTDTAREELERLNRAFHDGTLLGAAFYRQLGERGIDISRSILVELVPEGPGVVTGRLISPDSKVFLFDLDLDIPDLSHWDDVTGSFFAELKRQMASKPWTASAVAFQLFRDLRRTAK